MIEGSMCRDMLSCPIAVGIIVLMQKCSRSVAHEFVILGVEVSSLSYHLSAMLPAPRWQASDSHFPSSV